EALAKLKVVSAVSCWGVGAVAVLAGDGSVWLVSVDPQRRVTAEQLAGMREVEALHWDDATSRLWVAHHVDRVSAWQLADRRDGTAGPAAGHRRLLTQRPSLGGWRWVDRYLVTPLRFVTPQTAELGETIATIVSGENALQLSFAAA